MAAEGAARNLINVPKWGHLSPFRFKLNYKYKNIINLGLWSEKRVLRCLCMGHLKAPDILLKLSGGPVCEKENIRVVVPHNIPSFSYRPPPNMRWMQHWKNTNTSGWKKRCQTQSYRLGKDKEISELLAIRADAGVDLLKTKTCNSHNGIHMLSPACSKQRPSLAWTLQRFPELLWTHLIGESPAVSIINRFHG